jgi:two-component system sensor histidine kinase BaeS
VVDDPETVRRYLRTIIKEIDYLSKLIEDLSQLAQLDAGAMRLEKQPVDIVDLISDTLESFSNLTTSRKIHLEGDVAQNLGVLYVDPIRISRVINNLLENALNHTPPGGEIQLNAFQDGGKVFIQVCDSGSGISPDELPYIFDRFYRGEKSHKSSTRGSGLGLAISRGIIEAHGGSISVESRPGWTVFSIAMPVDRVR